MQHVGLKFTAGCAVLLLLLAGQCQQPDDAGVGREADGTLQIGTMEATETVRRGVTPGERTLVIDAFRGGVFLRASTDPSASLTFTKRGRGGDAESAGGVLESIAITESGTSEAYTYEVAAEDANRATVDVRGTIPPQTPLRVEKDVGPVEIDSLTGPLTVRQAYGDVDIRGAAGDTEVALESGDITVHLRRLPPTASVNLQTQNGNITLALPPDASARVAAETQAGVIRSQGLSFGAQSLAPLNAGFRYSAQLGDGEASVDLTTENGTVTLQAASTDPAADTTAPPDTLAPPTTPVPADSPATDGAQQQPASPDTLGPEPADPEPSDTAGTEPARPDPTPADTTGAPADTTGG
jgi:hypothetical protein